LGSARKIKSEKIVPINERGHREVAGRFDSRSKHGEKRGKRVEISTNHGETEKLEN
jgi:hypothetical protein